jgi:hypothetical protein
VRPRCVPGAEDQHGSVQISLEDFSLSDPQMLRLEKFPTTGACISIDEYQFYCTDLSPESETRVTLVNLA